MTVSASTVLRLMNEVKALTQEVQTLRAQVQNRQDELIAKYQEPGPPGEPGAQGPRGRPGETGYPPMHEWRGTMLRFQEGGPMSRNPDGSIAWGVWRELKGEKGDSGGGGGGTVSGANSTYFGDVADATARLALNDQIGQYGLQTDDPGWLYMQVGTPVSNNGSWIRIAYEAVQPGNLAFTLPGTL